MPEDLIAKIKIKKEWKTAFFSAVIIGFLTHMYVFTNMLPNHDGLNNIYNAQRKFYSGRFFLSPISGISSYFDLPWINGLLAILYLALGSVIIIEFFKMRKTLSIILTSGIFVTFPTVSATFSYMFTADGYMAAFLLSLLSVLVTKKYKYGFIPGALILFISVGVYQINLPMVLTVVGIWFIIELIFQRKKLMDTFRTLGRFILMTGIGMGLYAVLFKVYETKTGSITTYQGLDQVGIPTDGIKGQLNSIKNSFMDFFFKGFISASSVNLFEVLNVFLFLLIGVGIIISIINRKTCLSAFRMILLFLSIISLPIFVFILYFISPGVYYHMLMFMPLAFLYILPIIIYDKLEHPIFPVKCFSWATVVMIALIVFNFSIISNIGYFNMTIRYEKTFAYINRVYDRIEQTEGYENVSKMAVFGRIEMYSDLSTDIIPDKIPNLTGAMGETFLGSTRHYTAMLNNYFGKSLRPVSNKYLNELENTDTVQHMDKWPAKSSVQIIDDVVIVKFQ